MLANRAHKVQPNLPQANRAHKVQPNLPTRYSQTGPTRYSQICRHSADKHLVWDRSVKTADAKARKEARKD